MKKHKWFPALSAFALSAGITASVLYTSSMPASQASDHLDGPQVKAEANKAGDIADLYAFRRGDANGKAEDNDEVVFILTTVGEFSPEIRYDINISRDRANPNPDRLLSFRVSDGNLFLNDQFVGITQVSNSTQLEGKDIQVFAGRTDDPFFLDLRVITEGPATGKADPKDTFAGANVSAIAVSVPVSYLQNAGETQFYAWGVTYK